MIAHLADPSAGGSTNCVINAGGISVTNLCTQAGSLHIQVQYSSILPLLSLGIGALVLLVVSAVLPKRSRPGLYAVLNVLVGAVTLGLSIWQWYNVPKEADGLDIGGQIFFDHFAVLFAILISIAVILSSIASDSYLRRERLDGVEAYVLMLMSATGAVLMVEAATLISLFLGLEIMSIALYVMAAYHRRRHESGEAGLKYFLLGSFSSALFLYGIALVYGATGSVSLVLIRNYLDQNILANGGILLAGLALLIVGLGFKVAAVPFHFWAPDVYQGSPTPFTGYMAAVAKAAGFAGLLRILAGAFATEQTDWRPIIWVVAVLSLAVGSVLAIASKDLKRMLAYSSISQAGYVLLGVQAGTTTGTSAALFYLFTYTFIIIGSFAVIDVVQGRGEARSDLGAIRGLSRRHPQLAAAMLVLLLAQAGVPFTSGFLGKFYVIQASVQEGQYYLAVIAMVAAAAAAFFYLRLALLMYTAPADNAVEVDLDVFAAGLEPVPALDGPQATAIAVLEAPATDSVFVPSGIGLVLVVTVVFTIAAGVAPFAVDFARAATAILQ